MRHNESGLTLIEMMVATAIIGLVAVLITAFYVQGVGTLGAGQAAATVIADARFAVENMTVRLREATPGTVVVSSHAGMEPNQITFLWWDRNLQTEREIVYRLDGTNLQISQVPMPVPQNGRRFQPLASHIETLKFVVDPVTVPVRSVVITVTTVRSVPGSRRGSGLPFTMVTRVALRNN